MTHSIVSTDKAPAAIGPYSQATTVGPLVYTSGQIALSPETGQLVAGGIEAETQQVLTNLSHVLAAAGCSFQNVIKTTIFLTDLADFATVNEAYGKMLLVQPASTLDRSGRGIASGRVRRDRSRRAQRRLNPFRAGYVTAPTERCASRRKPETINNLTDNTKPCNSLSNS